jgi:hypothetical protein
VLPSVLLPAYDLIVALRERTTPVIGGFHTSLERECLEILLRGTATITVCPARTFDPETDRLYSGKLWADVKRGLVDGRVTIVPPPGVSGARITRANAAIRNAFLLDEASEVVLLYATRGGETERMAREALERGLPLSVLDHPANARWLDLGAKVWQPA